MHLFSRTILGLSTALILIAAAPPELLLKGKPNDKPSELSYTYMVAGSQADQKQADALAKQIEQLVGKRALTGLSRVNTFDSLPDVVFMLAKEDSLIKQALVVDAWVLPLPLNKVAAKKAVDALETRYFSGLRPTYTTVFNGGMAGYHNVRIPSVTATKNGTVVAVTEARANMKDQAENDMIVRRSIDGGKTWGEVIVAARDGEWSLNNPTLVYMAEQDRILMIFQSYPPRTHEGTASPEGHTMQSYMVTSDDQGATWSEKQNITEGLCPEGILQYCTGPGIGIVIQGGAHNGRIVLPCNAVTPRWFNYVGYSDDGGATWNVAEGYSDYGTNESQVVQTGGDELLFYARLHQWVGQRGAVAPEGWSPWSFDKLDRSRALMRLTFDGKTTKWEPTEVRRELLDPTCQGSIVRYGQYGDGQPSILLTANPSARHTYLIEGQRPYERCAPLRLNGSVRYSTDEGRSWSAAKRIYGNRLTQYQYSVLVPLEKGKVGCLFEASGEIKFAVFDMEWLTK